MAQVIFMRVCVCTTVLEPWSITAKAQINMHPENSNFDTAMVKLDVSCESLNVAWYTCQVISSTTYLSS
jgi:hypothetical protein